jgi:cytochrome c553
MKRITLGFIMSAVLGLAFSFALAAGDVAKGKALFNDVHFAGGEAGVSCNSCHPGGQGLEQAGSMENLEPMINKCIEGALKGKAIDVKSEEMSDIVAYIKSLQSQE